MPVLMQYEKWNWWCDWKHEQVAVSTQLSYMWMRGSSQTQLWRCGRPHTRCGYHTWSGVNIMQNLPCHFVINFHWSIDLSCCSTEAYSLSKIWWVLTADVLIVMGSSCLAFTWPAAPLVGCPARPEPFYGFWQLSSCFIGVLEFFGRSWFLCSHQESAKAKGNFREGCPVVTTSHVPAKVKLLCVRIVP